MASRRRRLVVAALALLDVASTAHAMGTPDCAPEDLAPVDAWLAKHPWHAGATTPDAMVAAACKLWPFDKRVLIVAAAYAQDKEQDKNLVVALVDTQAMALRSAFQGVVLEDATWSVTQASLRIDTARYDLAPGVRAIGVDVTSDALDAPVRGGITATRSLFVPDGARLRLVLDGFVLTTSRKIAGGATETSSAKMAIGSHRTHEFADLQVTRKTESGAAVRQERTTFTYDGSRYDGDAGYRVHQLAAQGETPQR
jgi:hypothetical protein